MSKIFLSGVSGFVGSYLWKYLEKENVHLHDLQLRSGLNAHALQESDAVVHLAGKAHDLKNVSGSEEYIKVNFELTKQLYDVFLRSDARVFIFTSSVKAAADHCDEELTEDLVPAPGTAYGKSKLMAETYIKAQTLPEGKSYYILRPCMIHGPGNKGNLNLLYQFIKTGIPYPLAAFDNKRSLVTVENLCFVIKELINREDIASGIYNVADDEALSTNRIVEIMAEAMSEKARLMFMNKGFVKAFAKIGDIISLPLNSERLQKLTESYIISNEKLKKALNKPLPVNTEEGLRNTIQSFLHKY